MRVSARILFAALFVFLAFSFFRLPAYAQVADQQGSIQSLNTNPDVPVNHHTFTQVELIDILSAFTCQLIGVDPTNPNQSCLGVDQSTGKIGMVPSQSLAFGQAHNQETPVGGAVGAMTYFVSSLYVPAISSTQYVQYLSDNFGIVKHTYAATNTNCNISPFGYGFCGLSPLLQLWTDMRDFSYAMMTMLLVALGIGVMLRFRVDPRTVMTLQNQIPRVIISIILITFSFAIPGAMIDVMWTATYAGVNFISASAPNSQIALCPPGPKPINQVAETRLLDQPISFTNTMFRSDCNAANNGLLNLSTKVSSSLGDLVQQLIHDLLFQSNSCHVSWFQALTVVPGLIQGAACALQNGAQDIILWITEQLIKLVIIITILIALFRLWYQLIKCYLTFLIFSIMGPLWIVLGLVPGRPMGFEKWLRIIFGNLAVFPLVAFILVFARVIVDAVPSGPTSANTVFIPPLIGNPSLSTFSDLMGFGAIMIAPTIPDLIKERLKAKGQSNLGAAVAGGVGAGAAAFSAPGRRAWESLNRKNPQTGEAEGPLAVRRQQLMEKVPVLGRRAHAARLARRAGMLGAGDTGGADNFHDRFKMQNQHLKLEKLKSKGNTDKAERLETKWKGKTQARAQREDTRRTQGPLWRRTINNIRNREQAPDTTGTTGAAPAGNPQTKPSIIKRILPGGGSAGNNAPGTGGGATQQPRPPRWKPWSKGNGDNKGSGGTGDDGGTTT